MLCHLRSSGAKPIGLEYSRVAVQSVRETEPEINIVLGDASNLPFAAETFSGLVAQHLVEHFGQGSMVLHEWYRILRKGGRLVIATPNAGFPEPAWFDDPTHQFIYDRQTLRDALEDAGFVVDDVMHCNPYLASGRFVFFAARHLQPLARIPWVGHRCLSLLVAARRPV
jgi:SAM-dependent methyltransferase